VGFLLIFQENNLIISSYSYVWPSRFVEVMSGWMVTTAD